MTDRTITEIPLDAIVEHPDQPRYSVRAIDELAASIDDVGLIEPIVVVHADGWELSDVQDCYRVIAGHRRTAAARKLGRQFIQAIVIDSNGRLGEVNAVMASNTTRDQLTLLEEARGYQTMLQLGMKAADVAKVAGRKKADVERTAKLAGAFSDEHREDLLTQPVSLDEYEALARHEGNPKAYERLLKVVGSREFKWTAETADRDAKHEAIKEKARAKLQSNGVQILKSNGKEARLEHLTDAEGKKLTAKSHSDCPGHAAILYEWAETQRDAIKYVCTDWEKHGHGHAYLKAGGGHADPYKEEQAKDRAWKKRVKPTTEPRRAWLKELLTGSREDLMRAGAHGFLIDAALHCNLDNGPGDLACDLLGVEVEKGGQSAYAERDAVRTALLMHRSPLAALLALALAAGDEAVRLSKPPDAHGWTTEHAVRYLRFIEAAGYMLTDVEVELVEAEQKAKQTDAAAEIESDDGDPVDAADTCPHCGEIECENTCAAAIAALGIDELDDLTDGELLGEFLELHKKAAMQSDETVDQDRLTILASEIESRGYDADDSAGLGKLLEDITKGGVDG